MKDERVRQLQKTHNELQVVKPLILARHPLLPRAVRLKYRVFASTLETKPHAYVYVHAAHLAGGGRFFVVNGDDVKFYDSATLDLVHIFDDDMRVSPANIAAIGEDHVAIGCSNSDTGGYLLTWDLRSYEVVSRIDISKPGVALTGVVRLDRGRLVVGDVRGKMHVVTHDTDGDHLRLQGTLCNEHDDGIYKLAVPHTDHALFAATSVDNTISVWDAAERVRIATIPVCDYVNIDINERYLACAGSGKLRVYEKQRAKAGCDAPANKNHKPAKSQYSYRLATCITYTVEEVSEGWNGGLKLLPDDLVIVGGAGDPTLNVIDLRSNAPIARYSIPFQDLVWLDITREARLILSSGEPQYGIHAVLNITAPKRVVEAFQLYTQQRYGKKGGKQGHDHDREKKRQLLNTIVGTVAKSILFCICIKSVRFALRRLVDGARRRKVGD